MVIESRKLAGLIIVIAALLVLAIVGVFADAIWGVSSSLFTALGGFITTIGGAQQGAQALADRSPNYAAATTPAMTLGSSKKLDEPASINPTGLNI